MAKKLFLETLGCAMNQRDSEHIIAELNTIEPYETTSRLEEADLIIINTCSVREKPVSKLFSEIGIFAKRKKQSAKIGVAGCTASHLGKEILKRAPVVDFVMGARNVSRLKELLETPKGVFVDINHDETGYGFGEYRLNPYKPMVNITIGCDKSCSFCIVPATRGKELSIDPDVIEAEVRRSLEKGAKEVMLLGQNVNNYGRRFSAYDKKINFTQLLQRLSAIEGLERIRFASPHPLHMDEAFVQEYINNPKLCSQIHIPLQSGSDRILEAMRRGYSAQHFRALCDRIRQGKPGVSISTDIIVGFPGESEEDFEQTMQMLEYVKFEQMFSFVYSPRPHTAAIDFPDAVDGEVASNRLKRLQERQLELLNEHMLKQVGTVHHVYFDELKPNGKVAGRSDDGKLVFVEGSESLLGSIAPVEILSASRTALEGRPL